MNEAYVNKVYGDGDKDIHFPYWRQVLQKEAVSFDPISLENELEKWTFIGEDEIALKHPKTGATFKLCDDGSIEFFVNEDTGIRLDPKDNSIIFYGDSVHFATKEMRMHTKPHGLIWNNHNFNPFFYHGEKVAGKRIIPKVSTETFSGKKDLPIFQEQKRKAYYDDKVNSIIEEIGIETAGRKRGR
ncbi:hypothetical protein [Cytobacillus oceanisediminis]|uniref:hypothetical protein n=1 Tax=Cytobacillus oceanisediminis TaxID=665099 RepID=UPI001FB33BEB|nr:hypothetical protein [Cytobacillus oceanisediminis]UOE58074.1 hypothetical protein IRB79_27820 [Cytobacillus oceanisediminis]